MPLKPGRMSVAAWRRGPLITPDANTVAHVVWRNGALVDLAGNSWTPNGSIATAGQVGGSGSIPPGAGPFGLGTYTLGAGADVLDFAGDFTLAMIARLDSFATGLPAVWSNTDLGTTGWLVSLVNGTSKARFYAWPNSTDSANAITLGVPFLLCCGMASGTAYMRLSGGSTTTQVLAYTQNSTTAARIGNISTGSNAWTGVIYEMYATTTPASADLFTSIAGAVSSRARRSL